MSDEWEVVDELTVSGRAEILRGLLEAQGIPVVLSQEGAGHFGYAMTIGRLVRVQILVPSSSAGLARQVLAEYYAGEFEEGAGSGEEEI